MYFFNPLSANPTKWSNTLKQFVDLECVWPFCGVGAFKEFIYLCIYLELRIYLHFLKKHVQENSPSCLFDKFISLERPH